MSQLIINFGSINIDHVYRVSHFVQPGETLSAAQLDTGLGGKGANQSVAIARAGSRVLHVGQISKSDQWALDVLEAAGVDVQHIKLVDQASGHAIIQVNQHGENAILLHGGANQSCDLQLLEQVLINEPTAHYLLIQNECNDLGRAIQLAHHHGIKIALNPAPMSESIKSLPLHQIDLLIVNQIEAQQLWGTDSEVELGAIARKTLPNTTVVLTLGAKGAVLIKQDEILTVPAQQVSVVDTTAAGDTFIGYLLSCLVSEDDDLLALETASAAAALSITKSGAIDAIPSRTEVQEFINA